MVCEAQRHISVNSHFLCFTYCRYLQVLGLFIIMIVFNGCTSKCRGTINMFIIFNTSPALTESAMVRPTVYEQSSTCTSNQGRGDGVVSSVCWLLMSGGCRVMCMHVDSNDNKWQSFKLPNTHTRCTYRSIWGTCPSSWWWREFYVTFC